MEKIYNENIRARYEIIAYLISKAKNENIFLKEAIRVGYYIIFHEISQFAVNNLVGSNPIKDDDWVKIFRSIEHKDLRNKFTEKDLKNLLGEAQDLSRVFIELQEKRNKADYDPRPIDMRVETFDQLFTDGLQALNKLNKCSKEDKISIATYLLFKKKDR